ncbi:hypothetical protein HYS31_07315 [Candidatus Woesearchaeota archaeon]|nr:hypothetical protein [Candidatus Woesearchaeota archaeon]
MGMQEVMAACRKCGNKLPSSSLKLDLDEGRMICPECIKSKKMHKEIEKELHKELPKENIAYGSATVFQSNEEKSSKIAHKCSSCGYKFKIDPETCKPKSCPYCNARVMGF